MSIKTRLIFAFAILVALVGSQAVISINQIWRVADMSSNLATSTIGRIEHVSHISTDLSQLRASELQLLSDMPSRDHEALLREDAALLADIRRGINEYLQVLTEPDRQARFDTWVGLFNRYTPVHDQIVTLATQGRGQQAMALFNGSQADFIKVEEIIHDLRHQEYASAQQVSQESVAVARRTQLLLLFALLTVIVIELGLGWYLDSSITGRLRTLMDGTQRVSQGDLTQRVRVDGEDEFSALAKSFNAMIDSLRYSQMENARLHREALQMREERIALLREQLTRVVKAQEDERQRVARELHDQAGQALAALQLGLSRLERTSTIREARHLAAELRSLTVETMDEIRNLAIDLRPTMLDELGLVPALHYYTRELSKRINLPIELEVSVTTGRLPAEIETALFRAVQESLTNIVKHAKATHAKVALTTEDTKIRIVVEDDGRGFDVVKTLEDKGRKSLGLLGMQERLELIGGRLEIHSQIGEGTRLVMELPSPLMEAKGD